jgi:hypothetical protein
MIYRLLDRAWMLVLLGVVIVAGILYILDMEHRQGGYTWQRWFQ